MHLTLYFLGEMPDAAPVVTALDGIDNRPFELFLGGIVVLPEPNVPRILAAGIKGQTEQLRRLHQRVSDSVFAIAEHKETRGFAPHLTFGRLKRGMPGYAKALKKALASASVQDSGSFKVEGFELVHSTLREDGPHYETLHRFRLA
jgi:2'-5' RNA ligase